MTSANDHSQRLAPPPPGVSRRGALREGAPWIVSVCAHAAALLIAFAVARPVEPAWTAPGVAVTFGEASAHDETLDIRLDDMATPDADRVTLDAPVFDAAPVRLARGADDTERFDGFGDALAAPTPARDASPGLVGEAVEGGGTDDLVAMAPARVDLFGVAGEQNAMRIVYVVDASGSMLPVMPVIRAEVRRSIETLDASQSFQVLAFTNGGVRTITGLSGARDGAMVRATRANKRAVASWFDTVDAGGVGDPMGALEHALRLRPDAVFLISKRLTDTAWTAEGARQRVDDALARLDTLNPRDPRSGLRPASIRVVHFYDDEPWDMLRIIGETHGGESGYVFVRRGEAWAR